MRIPLLNRLKRQLHRDIAFAQDLLVEAVYSIQEDAVLHGGTAVWRCFAGARFSEDLDFYFVPANNFRQLLAERLAASGMKLAKYKKTANTIYSKIEHDKATVSLEVSLRKFRNPIVREYEKADGSLLDVFIPPPEDLLLEKLNAYCSRKLVRDIYDVFHLSSYVDTKKLAGKVAPLLEKLPEPVDEKNLKTIVLYGAAPSFKQIAESLRRRFSQ